MKEIFQNNFKILIILLIIMLIGSILRIVYLDDNSFWTDELLSICHSNNINNLSTFFSPHCGNAHPPLYFLLLRFWSLGGEGEFYLRLLSVIFGILVIPTAYLLGRQFFDRKICLVGAFLVAISPFHMLYDREVRMYSLFTLLTIISLYFFIRALREEKSIFWIGYTIITILNTYTHYHAFLIILLEWVFFIVRYKYYKHLLKKAIISQFIVAFCFSFWVQSFLFHLKHSSVLGEDVTRFPTIFGAWIKPCYLFFSFSLGQTIMPWNYKIVIPAIVIFSCTFIWGIKSMIKYKETLLFFLLSLFVPIFVGLFITDLMPRYFVFLAPIYYLIIAKGISSFPNIKVKVVSMIIITILLSFSLNNYYTGREFHILANVDPWREVGMYLKENVIEEDIVFNIGGVPINYYTGFKIPILRENALEVLREDLQKKKFKKVWLIVSNTKYKRQGEDAIKWMNEHYHLISEKRYLWDPDYTNKKKFFKKNFLEYRIKIYLYENRGGPK